MNNTVVKSVLSVLIGATLLSGCTTNKNIPDNIDEVWSEDEAKNRMVDNWRKAEPPITFIPNNSHMVIEEQRRIPDGVYNQKIKTSFNAEATMMDLAPILKTFGLYMVIPEAEVRDQSIVLIDFEGKLGDYLNAMEAAYGVSFNYHDGNILTVDSRTSFQLKIPQDPEVAAQIQKDLSALGATDVNHSVHAGTVFYKATQRIHSSIVNYLERISVNTSLVSMQVAVITVQLDRHRSEGVNWSELNMRLGSYNEEDDPNYIPPTDGEDSDEGTGDEPIDTVDEVLGTNLGDMRTGAQVTGSGSSLQMEKGDFSLNAVIEYLSTYGKTETSQSLLMKTLSGREVAITSGQNIPYVDDIGSTESTDDDSLSNEVNIEFLDIGTKLNLIPWYDSDSQFVTIDVNLEISALMAWVDLQAGNAVGSITQPQTQEQTFTDVVKVMAGDSVIIGGITYDNATDNRNAPSFAEDSDIAFQDLQFSRNSTFILIRPTVTVFGADKAKN